MKFPFLYVFLQCFLCILRKARENMPFFVALPLSPCRHVTPERRNAPGNVPPQEHHHRHQGRARPITPGTIGRQHLTTATIRPRFTPYTATSSAALIDAHTDKKKPPHGRFPVWGYIFIQLRFSQSLRRFSRHAARKTRDFLPGESVSLLLFGPCPCMPDGPEG